MRNKIMHRTHQRTIQHLLHLIVKLSKPEKNLAPAKQFFFTFSTF